MRDQAIAGSGNARAIALVVALSLVVCVPLAPAFASQAHSRILYETRNPHDGVVQILSLRPDGTGRRLLAGQTFDTGAQWSPDGRMVAYVSSHRHHIVVMNADGSNKTLFTHGKGSYNNQYDSFPVWSPDGSRIAFQRGADSCGVRVIVKALDGSSRVVVTDNSSGAEGAEPPHWPVSWSPDGSRISYVRLDYCTSGEQDDFTADIYTASSVDGSDEIKVADNADRPLWSPVEDRLAYTAFTTTGASLVVSDGDGGEAVVEAGYPFSYDWSRSGRRIAYSTGSPDNPWNCGSVYVVRTDGSDRSRLTPTRLCTGDVSWSPSDRAVAFAARLDGAGKDWDLYRVRKDGSDLRRLTFARQIVEGLDW